MTACERAEGRQLRMKRAVIMGSLVLDIAPALRAKDYRAITDIFVQGKVTELSGVSFYMGGCVGNTGMALHKLGVDATLGCKVGRDFAGNAIELMLSRAGVPYELLHVDDAPTSVSIAITPPGIDKITLFLKGASQAYRAEDAQKVGPCDLFHFGYPVTMKDLYENHGEALMRLMRDVHARGITTSLDTALPRPDSEHGQVDWRPILERTLPFVDIFVPSYEECLFMLDREDYARRFRESSGRDMIGTLEPDEVRGIAATFLRMGAKIVLLKLGSRGLYLCTASADVLAGARGLLPEVSAGWSDRELWITPDPVAHIVSTTGAGDVAIAGFLASLLHGTDAALALRHAATAASLCIQSSDTISLLPAFAGLQARAAAIRRPEDARLTADGWRYDAAQQLYLGRRDREYADHT